MGLKKILCSSCPYGLACQNLAHVSRIHHVGKLIEKTAREQSVNEAARAREREREMSRA
jgi:hypothetical protein